MTCNVDDNACITQGDVYPFLWQVNYDCTGADKAELVLVPRNGGAPNTFDLVLTTPEDGLFTWDMDGTVASGIYDATVVIEFPDGRLIHSPTCHKFRLEVSA